MTWMNCLCPFGLFISVATLAINLLIEIPAEEFKPMFLLILVRISLATVLARLIFFLFSVTSKNASSSDNGSTKSVYSKKMSNLF